VQIACRLLRKTLASVFDKHGLDIAHVHRLHGLCRRDAIESRLTPSASPFTFWGVVEQPTRDSRAEDDDTRGRTTRRVLPYLPV
jgi:hypothetical protein